MSLNIRTELETISNLLHLAHHRNKNQHRLSKWWGTFSQLRRQLSKLCLEIDASPYHQQTTKSKSKSKNQKMLEERKSRVEQRAEFLLDILLERCYLAFSGVVANNQYSALGLMLLANLARVARLVKGLRRVEERVEVEAEGHESPSREFEVKEDLGVKIERKTESQVGEDDEVMAKRQKEKKRPLSDQDEEDATRELPAKKVKKKKKKKGGDIFDDLFDSLM
ncbi:hypothetical protein PVAG01_02443 [Phlyctema vagabunda]|uniref:RNase MRP protein 1 RNA binding domain-containing protein n=1 Tax=Phlyctema vagabunda TaxID=108571 RepID=A0ABR4PQK9_9HELO